MSQEKKTKINAKYYRGELFDLTVTSNNNIFGAAKIEHSIKNGINFKMEYFIDELIKIGKSERDDKSVKRKVREEFMIKCSENPLLKKLFDYLINYLNGGQNLNMENEYQENNLIVVLMGGNIHNIYFNLLYNIILHNDIDNIIKLFNDIVGLEIEIAKLITQINENLGPEFEKFIENMKQTTFFDSYSDLDFSLLPNFLINSGGAPETRKIRKQPDRFLPTIKEIIAKTAKKIKPKTRTRKDITPQTRKSSTKPKKRTDNSKPKSDTKSRPKGINKKKITLKKITLKKNITLEEVVENISLQEIDKFQQDKLEKSNGFLLYRIKSNFSIKDENIVSSSIEFFKKFIELNDTINRTYLNKPKDCIIADLEKLQIKPKDLMAQMSQNNWLEKAGLTEPCVFFIQNLLAKKKRTNLCTNKNTELICTAGNTTFDNLDKLKNLINYIRKLTIKINSECLSKFKKDKITSNNCFENLYTIVNNDNHYIINVCNHIIDTFYNLPETKAIIKNMINFYRIINAKNNVYTVAEFGSKQYRKLYEIKNNLNVYYNYSKFNKSGTITTINLVLDTNEKNKGIIGKTEPNEFYTIVEELIPEEIKENSDSEVMDSNLINLSQNLNILAELASEAEKMPVDKVSYEGGKNKKIL